MDQDNFLNEKHFLEQKSFLDQKFFWKENNFLNQKIFKKDVSKKFLKEKKIFERKKF